MTDDLSDLILDNKKQLKTIKKSQKAKSGRPKKDDSAKLLKKITVNLTAEEYKRLQQRVGTLPTAVFIKKVLADNGHL